MFKYKKLWIIIVISAMAVAGGSYAMKQIMDNNIEVFAASGYVLKSDANTNNEKIYFNENTKFTFSANDSISFTDKDDVVQTVDKDSFFHLANMFTTVYEDGVFMDLSETGNDYVTYYQTESGAIFTKNNGSYVISSGNNDYTYDELLWKLNDDRYIILGNNLKAVFGEDDVRDCGDYIELHYLDRGVVQIITEDNVWQTASTSCFLETEDKIQIYPIGEKILDTETERVSFMNTMVVNNDEDMHLRADQELEQIIPKFNVITTDGEDGESGESGETGEDGGKGQTGAWGADAGTTSSSKTEIPTMNIVEWEVTATSIKGAISITDTNSALYDKNDDFEFYICKPNSDKEIELVAIDVNGKEIKEFTFSDTEDLGSLLYFKTADNVQLEPDTEYNLILRGKYNMGNYKTSDGSETESWIYRDFINRTFYTDSLGVFLDKNSATSDSLTINVNKSAYSTAKGATIFLMSVAQSLDFTEDEAIQLANGTKTDNTIKKATISFDQELTNEVKTVTFDQLDSNTSYVARVLTTYPDPNNSKSTKQGLTDQKLNLLTLKTLPEGIGYPTVIGNRQQKVFEVYGVEVNDPDRAITMYRFTVKNQSDNKVAKVVEVSSSDYENMAYVNIDIDEVDIEFNKGYYLIETIVYNDNEKEVELSVNTNNQIMQSSSFELLGTSLPALSFRYMKDANGQTITTQYERIRGYLVVTTNGASIKLSSADTIDVSIICEGTYSYTKSYKLSDVIKNNSEILIPIDENYLQQGKIYNISANAYVDVNDGNGYVKTLIGTIVQATPNAPELKVEWSSGATTGNSISRTVKLTAASGNAEDIAYVKNTLSSVKFSLYSGSAASGTLLGQVTLTDTNNDEYESDISTALFTDGIELSETYFNISSSSLTSTSYQFTVSAAYDYTINSSQSHNQSDNICRNEITLTNAESDTVGLTAQPPNLPAYGEEDQCVRVTTITKGDAKTLYNLTSFGGDDISDDAVVGYSLLANYDDYGGLARQVTYYGFEANYFFEQVNKGTDPEDNASQRLFKVTLDIDYMNKGSIPSLIVWFGNPSADYVYNEKILESQQVFQIKGQNMIYAGKAVDAVSKDNEYLASGMGRGYEYIFSYEMGYSKGANASIDATYPSSHPNFQNWNAAYSKKPALCLHSTIQYAPKIKPNFETIPLQASGQTLVIKYRYSDPDDIVKYVKKDDSGNSKFVINGYTPNLVINIQSKEEATKANADSSAWEIVTFEGGFSPITQSTGVSTVSVTLNESLYNLSYSNIETEDESITVYETPWYTTNVVDFSDGRFTLSIHNDDDNLSSNKIIVSFRDSIGEGAGEISGGHDVDNIVGALLTFQPKEEVEGTYVNHSTKNAMTLFVPLDKSSNWLGTITLGSFADYLGIPLEISYKIVYDMDVFGWGYYLYDNDGKIIRDDDNNIIWYDSIASSFDSMFSPTTKSGEETIANPDYNVPYVALQETTMSSGFGYYLTKSLSSSTSSTSTNAINSYFRMYYYEYTFNNISHIGVRNLYYGKTSKQAYTNTFDINYNNRGVIYEKNTLKSIVAKKLNMDTGALYVEETFDGYSNNNTIVIDSIVPTASYSKVNVTTDTATFTGFQIDGMDQIYAELGDDGKYHKYIYAYIYQLDEKGSKIKDKDTGQVTYTIQPWEITDDDDGKTITNTRTKLTGLTKDKTYQVEFKVKTIQSSQSGNTTYKLTDLINAYSASNDSLTSTFTMENLVHVRGIAFTYFTDSYASKYYKLSYTLSQVNDIKIEYSIEQQTDEGWTEYLSHAELISKGIVVKNETNTYKSPQTEVFTVNPGIGGNKPLVPGRSYRLRIKVYSLLERDDEDKPLLVSEDPDDISSYVIKEFTIPQVAHPASMAISTPLFKEDISSGASVKNYGFSLNFTAIGDDGQVVMGEDYGEYCVRIYKMTYIQSSNSYSETLLTDTEGLTVTSSDNSINSLAQLYAKVFKSDTSTPQLTIWGLDKETRYRFSVYAALDEDLDGKNDLMEGISSLSAYETLGIKEMTTGEYKAQFDTLSQYFLLNSYYNTTPNETGVSVGYANSKASGSNLQVIYYNSSGLDRITKIVVSVVHETGSPALSATDGVIENVSSVLVADSTTNGKYTFTLPTSFISLGKSGLYTITINHYINDNLVYTYSGVVDK